MELVLFCGKKKTKHNGVKTPHFWYVNKFEILLEGQQGSVLIQVIGSKLEDSFLSL